MAGLQGVHSMLGLCDQRWRRDSRKEEQHACAASGRLLCTLRFTTKSPAYGAPWARVLTFVERAGGAPGLVDGRTLHKGQAGGEWREGAEEMSPSQGES